MSLIRREETGPTWRQLLEEGQNRLLDAGVADAGLDAWYLLEAAFGIDRVHYYLDQDRPVREAQLAKGYGVYEENLERRASRIPLQQILGNQEFMGLSFFVNEHVLIPRQDTETLVETVLREYPEPERSVLDMCTGSGCIAVSLAVLGGYEQVTAADISLEALKVAKKNARRHFLIQKGTVRSESSLKSEDPWRLELKTYLAGGSRFGRMGSRPAFGRETAAELAAAGKKTSDGKPAGEPAAREMAAGVREHRLTLLQSNLFSRFSPEDRYDLIVSNPPYIPSAVLDGLEPEVRDHEPRIALDGLEDGLHFYRVLALECSKHLNPGGSVCFEIGYDQAEAVGRILAIAGYSGIETIKDAPGQDRVVRACWNR